MRLVFLGRIKLTVSRVEFQNRPCGTMSKILALLVEFCKAEGIERIMVQSVQTIEIAAFCKKHGFQIIESSGISINGLFVGDYQLEV